MKVGMQREVVVAYWLLFDEFEVGEDDPAPATEPPGGPPSVGSAAKKSAPASAGRRPNRPSSSG